MPNLSSRFKKLAIGAACVTGVGLLGMTVYSETPDYEKAQKVLQDSGFKEIEFSNFFRYANCENAKGPARTGWYSASFKDVVSPEGKHLGGKVCFDRKQENAEIVFSREMVMTESHPGITVQLKK